MPKRISKKRVSRIPLWFIIALILFLLAVWLIVSLSRSSWDASRRFTIVVSDLSKESDPKRSGFAIFSIEPKTKKAVYLSIPPDLLIDVPYGYKTYPASSVYRLGTLDEKRGGGLLLAKSAESTLGIAVEGYIVSTLPIAKTVQSKEDLEMIKQSYFSWYGGLKLIRLLFDSASTMDTNLSAIDLFRLWNAIHSVRNDQIRHINLDFHAVYDTITLPDGTNRITYNADALDAAVGNSFQDSSVRAEKISIEVGNATSADLLATRFASILTRLGADVIRITTAKEKKQEPCILNFKDTDAVGKSKTLFFLRHVYGCQEGENRIEGGISDIMVVLGEEFIQ